jgi:flagellar protein FlaG
LAGVTAAFQGGSGGAAPVAKVTVADQAQPTHDDVRRTVAAVNQRLQQNNVALQFSRDDVNGQTVISVVDRETHQIITQIPSQTVIELNRQLEKITRGHLVQENV